MRIGAESSPFESDLVASVDGDSFDIGFPANIDQKL